MVIKTGAPVDGQTLEFSASAGKHIYRNPFFLDPTDARFAGGADPTGVADSLAAFQACVNFAITGAMTDSAVPPMPTRYPKWAILVPPGSYLLSGMLKIYAAQGLVFEGAGAGATYFLVGGSSTISSLIDVNGCGACAIGKFTITNGTGNCTTVLNIDSLAAVSKLSGEFNHFHDITIASCNFVTGVAIGAGGTSNAQDTYHHQFEHISVYGGRLIPVNHTGNTTNGSAVITGISTTTGINVGDTILSSGYIPATATVQSVDSGTQITLTQAATVTYPNMPFQTLKTNTYWKKGVQVGGVGFGLGNVLQHSFHGCNISSCEHGLEINSSNVLWRDGAMQENGTDVYLASGGLGCPVVIEGVRSESSGRLVATGVSGGAQMCSIRDYGFFSAVLHPDTYVINYANGGQFVAENIIVTGQVAGWVLPGVITGSINPQMAMINGLTMDGTNPDPVAWLNTQGNICGWIISNVGMIGTPGSGTVSAFLVGPVSSNDRTGVAVSYTAISRDKVIGVTSTAAARTITLPALSAVSLGHTLSVKDESGAAATNNITVAGAGTDKIQGAATSVINTNFGVLKLYAAASGWMIT